MMYELYLNKAHTENSILSIFLGFPGISVSKKSACSAGDLGLIPGSGRSPGEGNGNLFQYYCLENPMDRGAWQSTIHRVARVGHDLGTKPPPPSIFLVKIYHLDGMFQTNMLVSQLCLTLCDPMDYSLPDSSVHGQNISPGKNTEVDSHSLLQGIFPTQESNLGLLHCRQILYCVSHQTNRFTLSENFPVAVQNGNSWSSDGLRFLGYPVKDHLC